MLPLLVDQADPLLQLHIFLFNSSKGWRVGPDLVPLPFESPGLIDKGFLLFCKAGVLCFLFGEEG